MFTRTKARHNASMSFWDGVFTALPGAVNWEEEMAYVPEFA
jgi:hypothetical protein